MAQGPSSLPVPGGVPIAFRSPRFREATIGSFQITDVWFPPGTAIEPHHHERPNIGVMLAGSFDLTFASARTETACDAGVCFVEPAGATHSNCVHCGGAHVVAIQPDPADAELLDPLRRLLESPWALGDPRIAALARRIGMELTEGDRWSRFALEGLVLELLAVAGRIGERREAARPVWLDRVEERLRDCPATSQPTVVELAREAGIHPAQLARLFRRSAGRSIGRFLLERRIEWAAARLARGDRSVASLAAEAGFADQSHFTRRFRQVMGTTPGRYRASSK